MASIILLDGAKVLVAIRLGDLVYEAGTRMGETSGAWDFQDCLYPDDDAGREDLLRQIDEAYV